MARMKDVAVDAAGPDADIVVHPLLAQQLRHRLRGRENRVAAAIEVAQPSLDDWLQEGHAIVSGIGFEARVDRCDDRRVHAPCELDRTCTQ